MRNLIRTVVLLALLGSRTTIAQTMGSAGSSAGSASATVASSLTQNMRLIGDAPVGHRQPHPSDIPSQNASDLEHISEEDAALIASSIFAAAVEVVGKLSRIQLTSGSIA
jgi:hypothetical protein